MSADAEKSARRESASIGHLQMGKLPGLRHIERRLTDVMDRRADAVVVATLRSCEAPNWGVRIVLTELGASLEVSDQGMTLRHQVQVISYLEELCERFDQLPHPGVPERVFIILRYGARLSILSTLPLGLRRHALYCLAVARDWVGRRVSSHHQRQQALTVLLSVVLDEPSGKIRGLLRQHQFWLEYYYARRLMHLGQDRNGERLLATFQWPEREAYLALGHKTQQARVLVTIHMGDFFGAFKYIAAHADPARTVTSLRREKDDGAVQGLLLNNPSGHHIARPGTDQPLDIVAALRRGNHTLTALFDLPESFGETVEVMFFGQPARFVRGPAQLAIMGRAWIVPFVTYEQSGRQHIEMASLIRADRLPGETLMSASARVTQQLVRQAERWIKNRPEQWKYLDRMMSYINVAAEPNTVPVRGKAHA